MLLLLSVSHSNLVAYIIVTLDLSLLILIVRTVLVEEAVITNLICLASTKTVRTAAAVVAALNQRERSSSDTRPTSPLNQPLIP